MESYSESAGKVFNASDHIIVARSRVATTMSAARVMPATNTTGNRTLTLADCRAIALANNLDIQVARIAEFTQAATAKAQLKRVLPHLVSYTERSDRDNPSYAYGQVLGLAAQVPKYSGNRLDPWGRAGSGVTSWSRGRQKETSRSSIELNWSPTEAIQNFFSFRTARSQGLSAQHARIRKIQETIGAVDQAYYRLLAYQQCAPLAGNILRMRAEISHLREALLGKNLLGADIYYASREKEIRARLVLSQIKNQVERQRDILAKAMTVSPNQSVDGGFMVNGNLDDITAGPSDSEAEAFQMEAAGAMNRPEIYQATLEYLNAVSEVRKTLYRYCPEVKGFWRSTLDQDKFLYNNDYKEIGVTVRLDLLDWLSNMDSVLAARFRQSQGEKALDALVVNITSQIRQAALKYFDAVVKVKAAQEALRNAQMSLETARIQESKGAQTSAAVIEASAEALQKRLEKIIALGEAHANLAELDSVMAVNYAETPSY